MRGKQLFKTGEVVRVGSFFGHIVRIYGRTHPLAGHAIIRAQRANKAGRVNELWFADIPIDDLDPYIFTQETPNAQPDTDQQSQD